MHFHGLLDWRLGSDLLDILRTRSLDIHRRWQDHGDRIVRDFADQFHGTHADANGYYTLTELPVGPLTFSTADAKGNTAYASGEIRQPGEVVTQNLVILKRDVAGFGTVHITVRRSDQTDSAGNFIPVPNAHVGVWQQGYGLADGFTDSTGQFTFTKVPAGQIQILAADFTLTRESISWPLDLKPDQTLNQILVLHVPNASDLAAMATIVGHVRRDDPTSPGNSVLFVPVRRRALCAVRGCRRLSLGARSVPAADGGLGWL